MSLKDIFENQTASEALVTNRFENLKSLAKDYTEVESPEYVSEYLTEYKRLLVPTDFSTASNFVKFGSYQKYYEDAITRIQDFYPYDGSLKEKKEWRNKSTAFDLYVYDKEYPKSTGYVTFDGTSNVQYIKFNNVTETNIYNPSVGRQENVRFDFSSGSTIEFWMKKTSPVGTSDYETLFTFSGSNSAINLYMSSNNTTIYTEYFINSTGQLNLSVDTGLASVADSIWHHYALTYYSNSSGYAQNLFLDGQFKTTSTHTATVKNFTGSIIGTIGTSVSASKLKSTSIDEFRFWNTTRTPKEIGRYYFVSDVGGGTNTDLANTDLGVYYKFNEGITLTSSIDAGIIDYSGRISNGTFIGYSASCRSTGSAIVESGVESFEYSDPILRKDNPLLSTYVADATERAYAYDYDNSNSMYNLFPAWITEEDAENGYTLKNVIQAVACYFDELYQMIKFSPKLKHIRYDDDETKIHNFYPNLIQNYGFTVPDFLEDVKAIEHFLDRDESILFEDSLYKVKNRVMQNLYNNIIPILKSKGTEKAFRSFIRSYGVDDNIYRMNYYFDGAELEVKDRYQQSYLAKNYVNFSHNGISNQAVVYSSKSGSTTSGGQDYVAGNDSVGFISGTSGSLGLETYTANTYQVDVIFPKAHLQQYGNYSPFAYLDSSIFGVTSAQASGTTTLTTDKCNFHLYCERDELNSTRAKFILSAFSGTVVMSSSYYNNVYDNGRWNFAVKVYPNSFGQGDLTGTPSDTSYFIELYGVNTASDLKINEFSISSSVTQPVATQLLGMPRRVYAGAKRTNVTGSLLMNSDIKLGSVRGYMDYLDNDTVYKNAIQIDSYGNKETYKNSFLSQDSINDLYIPKLESIFMNWDFDQVSSVDSNGKFFVTDFTSGSVSRGISRFGTIGGILKAKHDAVGDLFYASDSSTISKEYLSNVRNSKLDQFSSDSTIEVRTQDDLTFTMESRPVRNYITIEKSAYAAVSDVILKGFSGVFEFNNLIGDHVNTYRHEYKEMNKIRQYFFEKYGNTPDIEKYIEYYKWFDSSLSSVITQLFPASADINNEVSNVVESHVLERNKIQYKFPTLRTRSNKLEGSIK